VGDTDVVSAFWDGTMCHSLVHELSCELPKTTKELLNIATRHSLGEEAIGATFTLVNVGMAVGGGRATPTNATVRSTKGRGLRAERRGKSIVCAASLR
jgi:hypothetical protein